jgi:hypothetical protein
MLGKKMEDWRKYYNDERPRGAIGQKPPIMLLYHVAQPARDCEREAQNLAAGCPKVGFTAAAWKNKPAR